MVFTLLVLEAAVRWFYAEEIDPVVLQRRLEVTSIRGLIEPSADAALLFELKPNSRQWFQGRWVRTSADGYRVSAMVAPATPATPTEPAAVRIAVLGDSTSFGWGVAYEETYAERYRERMEALSGKRIEMRNYSVPAYNAAQELRVFQLEVAAYRPDLILLHHDHNDTDPTTQMMGTLYMPVEYGDNPLGSALVKWAVRRLRQERSRQTNLATSTGNRRIGGYVVSGPLYDGHLEARRRLVEEASALEIPVVAVIFNAFVTRDEHWRTNEHYTELHRKLADRLAGMGYYVLDLYPHVQELLRRRGWANLGPLWNSPEDGHPNAEGHQFIADTLVDYTLETAPLGAVFGIDDHARAG